MMRSNRVRIRTTFIFTTLHCSHFNVGIHSSVRAAKAASDFEDERLARLKIESSQLEQEIADLRAECSTCACIANMRIQSLGTFIVNIALYRSIPVKDNGDSVQIAKQGADSVAAEVAQMQELRKLLVKNISDANDLRARTEAAQARRNEGDTRMLNLDGALEEAVEKAAQKVRKDVDACFESIATILSFPGIA
jgi:hypothetical protein